MSTDATISPRTQQPVLARQRAKDQQHQRRRDSDEDTRSTRSQRMSAYFPLSYKEAAHQWWTSISPPAAERNVLSLIPFLREATTTAGSSSPELLLRQNESTRSDPFGHRVWRSTMVKLSGKNRVLNEYSIERVGEPVDETLVMLHGYGAGLGFFYKNFEPLSRARGWKLYALDMLGMGNSSRPHFRVHAKDPAGKITEAENFFIDALEEWRRVRNIERFTLLGHSMGGYLAVSYALKYPGHLNKLILVSPVGIPEDPYAVNADMPEPEESTMASEFTQDQESIVSDTDDNGNLSTARNGNGNGNGNGSSNNKKGNKAAAAPRRPLPGWLVWLWDSNFVSPFSIVRAAGPLGPRFVSGWTSRRFNHLPADESQALHTYSYSLFRQKGSGEFALPYILAPGAYARRPLVNRIQDVGRGVVRPAGPGGDPPEVRETGIPVVMMYGDHDWMDVAGGYAAEEKLKRRAEQALAEGTEEERARENGSAKVVIVRKAGHHLYLDNADEFNEHIIKELEETRREDLRQKAGR
ncbi:Alpha/beta-hydrolase [Pleurostoma richardsiae]|uniref:Alpha/beta-hydrolase n=1 Tax=Pleurostoma richardsiae TaxID=41990 RepID=A0AA38R9J0_9PEZI|nr:Alpha/beta-hydrolase [Pleurostoma richardsiae]